MQAQKAQKQRVRSGRPRSPDPRIHKKTAMVTADELEKCDEYRQLLATTTVDSKGNELTLLPSRSDVARDIVLSFIDDMHHRGMVHRPGRYTYTSEPRTERIAGVFTAGEHVAITNYCQTIGWTFSNVLREALLLHLAEQS